MYGTCNYKWKISISRVAMRGTLTEKEREEDQNRLGETDGQQLDMGTGLKMNPRQTSIEVHGKGLMC